MFSWYKPAPQTAWTCPSFLIKNRCSRWFGIFFITVFPWYKMLNQGKKKRKNKRRKKVIWGLVTSCYVLWKDGGWLCLRVLSCNLSLYLDAAQPGTVPSAAASITATDGRSVPASTHTKALVCLNTQRRPCWRTSEGAPSAPMRPGSRGGWWSLWRFSWSPWMSGQHGTGSLLTV